MGSQDVNNGAIGILQMMRDSQLDNAKLLLCERYIYYKLHLCSFWKLHHTYVIECIGHL